MSAPTVGALLARLALAHGVTLAPGAAAVALLVPRVLVGALPEVSTRSVRLVLLESSAGASLLLLATLLWWPLLQRACRGAPLSREERRALRALPRAASLRLVGVAVALGVVSQLSVWGVSAAAHAMAGSVALCMGALASLVLYAAARWALRPALERAGVEDPSAAFEEGSVAPAERLASRAALGVAVPAATAALLASLAVGAHVREVQARERAQLIESFEAALNVPRRSGEGEAGPAVAASALGGAGEHVLREHGRFVLPAEGAGDPGPPWWALPLALLVGAAAGWWGSRVGRSAGDDVEDAARRLGQVVPEEIRSVTMRLARPRSVPEIRELALALDTLAATLVRMAEDRLRALNVRTEASRVRSFVLASVSHDLRAPLNGVLGFAGLLLSGAEGPLTDGQRESLDAVVRGGRDLLRLVDDLLDHARLDAGRMRPEPAEVEVDALVDRAREEALARSKVPLEATAVRVEGEAGLRARVDEMRTAQALGALLAFVLLRPGASGEAVLRVRAREGRVVVTLRGGGSALTREALERMFDPFDFAPAGARAPAGLNLAVSVARGVLELQGGAVEAQGTGDGGFALTAELPSAAPVPEAKE